jgi:hypothetical protein
MTPRCPVRGCPVRYRAGPDRACPEHQDQAHDELGERMAELTGTDTDALMAAPGEHPEQPPQQPPQQTTPGWLATMRPCDRAAVTESQIRQAIAQFGTWDRSPRPRCVDVCAGQTLRFWEGPVHVPRQPPRVYLRKADMIAKI